MYQHSPSRSILNGERSPFWHTIKEKPEQEEKPTSRVKKLLHIICLAPRLHIGRSPSDARCCSSCGFNIALMSLSTMFMELATYLKLIFPSCERSVTKWWITSVCLAIDVTGWEEHRVIHATLSPSILVGPSTRCCSWGHMCLSLQYLPGTSVEAISALAYSTFLAHQLRP